MEEDRGDVIGGPEGRGDHFELSCIMAKEIGFGHFLLAAF